MSDPTTDQTPALIRLWQRVLTLPEVDASTNFFVHGGHSLLGLVLLDEIERETGTALRLADLFKHPTPARLAQRLAVLTAPGPVVR